MAHHRTPALSVAVIRNGDPGGSAAWRRLEVDDAPLECIHPETAVRASFEGEGAERVVRLYGRTGRRLADGGRRGARAGDRA